MSRNIVKYDASEYPQSLNDAHTISSFSEIHFISKEIILAL